MAQQPATSSLQRLASSVQQTCVQRTSFLEPVVMSLQHVVPWLEQVVPALQRMVHEDMSPSLQEEAAT